MNNIDRHFNANATHLNVSYENLQNYCSGDVAKQLRRSASSLMGYTCEDSSPVAGTSQQPIQLSIHSRSVNEY